MAKARAAAYSDDEYADISQFQRQQSRRRRRRGFTKEKYEEPEMDFGFNAGNKKESEKFWRQTD